MSFGPSSPPAPSSTTPISLTTPSPSSQAMAATNINPSSNADLNPATVFSPVCTSVPTTPLYVDRSGVQSPTRSDLDTPVDADSANISGANALVDVDAQILEALKSKDRIYVLKLGEQMESLINDRRSRLELVPATSYQRLLVHRCSAYHRLQPDTDQLTKNITITATIESRIPSRRICELVPAESYPQPTFKIMRRTTNDRGRSKPQSQAESVAGEDAELSDVEPSESGSLGGRSNATGSSKKRLTIEEREAAYNEARSRIFMDFEEKDKEKDLSASSSSISLTSASVTSAGGETSSVGDLDDALSSPATESEWSGPVIRDKKDGRRNGSNHNSSGPSSRALRSSAPPFNVNGSNSTCESRASSPSFKYPSLYEPTPVQAPYEASQASMPSSGFVNSYLYTYPQPVPTPSQNYLASYPYYTPYPYPHHPQGPVPNSDPASPGGPDVYTPAHQPTPHAGGVYMQYPWPHPSTHQLPSSQPHVQHQHHHSSQPQPAPNPPAPLATQYSPYVPPVPPYGPYPMPGYYPSPHTPLQHLQPSPPQMSGQVPYSQDNRMMNGHNGTGIVNDDSMVHTRSFSGTSVGQHGNMKQRGAPPARHAWSYGPGVGMGGYGVGNINNTCSMAGETVGPRLSSTMRRTSGTSSSSTGNRTPGDEASSTASSSTTSSSSRRTFTSTSSQHPLPARPDWAVGLKPQPTLHATHPRHHDHSLNSSRNMSPARNSGQLNTGVSHQPHQLTSNVLQPTDFPPLTTLSPGAEKRAIPVAGAWTNSSSTRSILMPGPSPAGNVLVHHSNTHVSGKDNSRLEDSERGFERPPPKGNVELFNPKGVWKSGANPQSHQPSPDRFEKDRLEKEKLRGEVVANAILVDKVATMSVEDKDTTCAAPPPVALAT